ncbi:hypothetical protein [Lederbergia sp. NSJ-179]|uniref:hypothetical protein n=1 Tax=Lederbergia sp. NSJ-179 TaxID=2931402 RepID=UPI0037BFEABE
MIKELIQSRIFQSSDIFLHEKSGYLIYPHDMLLLKGGFAVDWLQRMNNAIDYIEDNLENKIEYEQIARIALCSVYEFQRMFSFVLEIPLSEYIRRRRLRCVD